MIRAWLVTLALALPACGRDPPPPPAPAGATTRTVEGIPVLRLRGGPRELGTQAGTLLKEPIRTLLREYMSAMLPDDRSEALQVARRMEARIPERYLVEMRALAEAAGVAYDDILLANVMVELFQMCSAAVVRGPRAEGGTLVLGRNLDFPDKGVLSRHSVVIVYERADGRSFAAVTWPGLVGVLSGMNSDGLSVANLIAVHAGGSSEGCPYMFLLREMLEEAATVDEALARLRARPRTTANSIMIADGRGDAAVAEVTHDGMAVRRPEDDRLFATNDFRSGAPDVRCERYDCLERLVSEARSPIGTSEMAKLLDEVDLGSMNVQSMIFVPARREVLVSLRRLPAAKGPFVALRPFE